MPYIGSVNTRIVCENFFIHVCTDEGITEEITTESGLPEGNVLSPLLYIISKIDFQEDVQGIDIENSFPEVLLNGCETSSIMYIDDEAINALTGESLQKKIDKRADYFYKNGTIPNIQKTEIGRAHV